MPDPRKPKPEAQPSAERELAEGLVLDLEKRERRTARELLLLEARGVRRYRKAVRGANDMVVVRAVSTESDEATLHTVRNVAAALQTDLQIATRFSVADARATARAGLEREAERELPLLTMAAEDEAIAVAAGQTLAGAWASTAIAAISSRGDTSLARVVASIPATFDHRLRRTAATEVARSYNDERGDLLVELDKLLRLDADDPEDPNGPAGRPKVGVYKVRSEVLDRATCDHCFGADGEIVEADASFKSGMPPSHPYCRGIVEHIIIPKPQRLEDIAIDYDLLKQELRDVIREHREVSDRHALSFVSDSQGSKRSAEVLTRRFREERYATNEPTAAGGRIELVVPRKR